MYVVQMATGDPTKNHVWAKSWVLAQWNYVLN